MTVIIPMAERRVVTKFRIQRIQDIAYSYEKNSRASTSALNQPPVEIAPPLRLTPVATDMTIINIEGSEDPRRG